jgi:hypothetical protein
VSPESLQILIFKHWNDSRVEVPQFSKYGVHREDDAFPFVGSERRPLRFGSGHERFTYRLERAGATILATKVRGGIIIPLTSREILNEQLARKLA